MEEGEMEGFQKLKELGEKCIESKDASSEACKEFSDATNKTRLFVKGISNLIINKGETLNRTLSPVSHHPEFYTKEVLKEIDDFKEKVKLGFRLPFLELPDRELENLKDIL